MQVLYQLVNNFTEQCLARICIHSSVVGAAIVVAAVGGAAVAVVVAVATQRSDEPKIKSAMASAGVYRLMNQLSFIDASPDDDEFPANLKILRS